jgi:predicted nucleic acid-binding protein
VLAVDTSVIVRYLTPPRRRAVREGKCADQRRGCVRLHDSAARNRMGAAPRLSVQRERVIAAFGAFAGLPRVTLEDPALTAKALDWTRRGMDFADALHLATAQGCEAFVSFDRRLAATASAISGVKLRA